MNTSPTEKEIRANALRYARNTWCRFTAYKVRFNKKYKTGPTQTPAAFFDNRIYEDSFAKSEDENLLPHGKKIETRQDLANPIMLFRAQLEDPSGFDEIFAMSLARRMPGYKVTVSKAMSASKRMHEKDSIRTFVTKV